MMRLICGRPSGFSRKARVVVHELGLADRVTVEFLSPQSDAEKLAAVTPLGKVPVLVVGQQVILDSPVICAYLCERADDRVLLPQSGAERWQTLCREAIADGILEAGMLARAEGARGDNGASNVALEWQRGKMQRGLEFMENSSHLRSARHDPDLGDIALGCAIGWINFRLPELDMLARFQRVRDRFERWRERASFVATEPRA